MLRYDVLCVGSATVDQFLTVEPRLQSIKIGDKVLVTNMEVHSGGGATNSAAALAKLGLKVKMLTKLGNDHNAEIILKEMKQYNVKNVCLHHSKKNTDFAVLVSSVKEKDRIIYVHKGASRDLMFSDCKKTDLRVKWIYLASLLGKSFRTAKEIAQYAHKKKINVLFNPSLYVAEKGKMSLKQILNATTMLVLNKEEAQALLKTKSDSFPKLLKGLQALGPRGVVITNGTKKFSALRNGHSYTMTPPKVKRVHTAGAGDAFTSGLLAGMIRGWEFEDCLCLGQANASSLIQQIGTKNGLLNEKEAKCWMKKLKMRVHKQKL